MTGRSSSRRRTSWRVVSHVSVSILWLPAINPSIWTPGRYVGTLVVKRRATPLHSVIRMRRGSSPRSSVPFPLFNWLSTRLMPEIKSEISLTNHRADNAYATKTIESGLILDLVKLKTTKLGIHSFPASSSAIKRGSAKPPPCVASWLEDRKRFFAVSWSRQLGT